MADRSVAIRLRVEAADAIAKFRAVGAAAESAMGKAQGIARKNQAEIRELGNVAGGAALVIGGALAAAGGAAANFEQSMSNVQAATHESADAMELLRQAALDAGQRTAFSATESAAAIENLAKAGVSTADILGGGLDGALDLAAAGSIEVADAAEIAATAMTQFGLSGQDVPHIADLLAAAAGKAQGEVGDMAYALKQSGLVASQMGVSIEETTGTLAAFASAGLLGSDAGTSFRTMLLRLANPSSSAKGAMEDLGLAAYDAQGAFIGIEALAGQLETKLADLTQAERDKALATIFGSDAIRAANVLYEKGAEGVADWTERVDDAGYAAETAAIKMDNLKGDFEQFMGALETALIGTGEGAQGPLRELVQLATDAVNAFNGLPGPVKNSVFQLGLLLFAASGAAFVFSRAVTGVSNFRSNLDTLRTSASQAGASIDGISKKAVAIRGGAAIAGMALAMIDLEDSTSGAARSFDSFADVAGAALIGFAAGGPLGAAIGAGVTGLGQIVSSLNATSEAAKAAKIDTEDFAGSLDTSIEALRDDVASLDSEFSSMTGWEAFFNPTRSFSLDSQLDESRDKLLEFEQAADSARNNVNNLLIEIAGGSITADQFSEHYAGAAQALSDANIDLTQSLSPEDFDRAAAVMAEYYAEAEVAGDESDVTADAVAALGDEFKTSAEKAEAFVDAILKLNEATLDSRQAARDYEASIDAIGDVFEERKRLTQELADAERDLRDAESPEEREDAREKIADLRDEMDQYRKTLDITTEAGRNNQALLDDMARSALDRIERLKDERASVGEVNKVLRESRQELRQQAERFGLTRREAREYVNQVLKIPPKVSTAVETNGLGSSLRQVREYNQWLNNLDGKTAKTYIEQYTSAKFNRDTGARGLFNQGFADGGYTGAGGKFQPAGIVHRGEFVVRSEQTARHRSLLEAINSGRGYAGGGYVGHPMTATLSSGSLERQISALADVLAMRDGGVQFHGPINVRDGRDLMDAAAVSRRRRMGGI